MNGVPPDTRRFTTAAGDAGTRLDLFLTSRCPDLSRSQVARAVDAGGAEVDGRRRPRSHRLREGEAVVFVPLPPPPSEATPQDLPLKVVHEDDEFLVLDKAAGMVVHPAPGHPDGTLVNALVHRFGSLPGGDPMRPGIVHRLDRDTSGLMVVALTPLAHRRLAAQLRDRSLGRTYLALSWGAWSPTEGTLRDRLGRHPTQRVKIAVLRDNGREAVTHYEVREDFGFVQLCAARLETGRTHQIRVQFAHAGHPVVGDPLYGDDLRARRCHPLDREAAARLVRAAPRQLLHAAELRLRHPATGEPLILTSSPPPDFMAALEGLRAG